MKSLDFKTALQCFKVRDKGFAKLNESFDFIVCLKMDLYLMYLKFNDCVSM